MIRSSFKFLLATVLLAASAVAGAQPLRAGVDGTFAPHAMPKLGGGVEGFNVDLLMEIGKQLGRPVEIVAAEFSGLIPAMNAKTLDFVGAPTTVTPERSANLLFSEGYLNTYYQFLVPAGKPDLKTTADLKGKTVSSNKGSAYDKWLIDNADKYGFKVRGLPDQFRRRAGGDVGPCRRDAGWQHRGRLRGRRATPASSR